MTAKIGPTFSAELQAAGIPLDGIVWDPQAGVIVTCPDTVKSQIAAVLAAHDPTKVLPPDNPTLGDWRVGLALWKRTNSDGTTTLRLNDVTTAVQNLLTAGDPLALVAQQRLEYSNNVLRDELLLLKGAFGFTVADVDESLYRAHQVSLSDLSGVWPLPTT